MADRTKAVLATLREQVQGAKAVPMSASCMLNRAETLALIDKALAALVDDTREAERVTATSLETLERAQDEAILIIKAAEEKAVYLASSTPVMEKAKAQAAELERRPRSGVAQPHLRATGQSGACPQPASLATAVALDLVGERRARPNQAHLSLHHVDQLGQFIQARCSKERSC